MQNPFKKKKIVSPRDGIYSYHHGETLSNGTEEFAFEYPFNLPSLLFRGAGRLAGTLSIFPGPQSRYHYRVTQIGLGGLPAGFIYQQPLIEHEPEIEGMQ
jgi:hypothetical protein